ncbi:anthrone oxygenase family protein [Paracoccus salsus]|uniref:anthrone oxygenase family protein n=1 Tax=Paracoccus salsus TaxID=2911061 RepID=UPI001F208D24|nr:anthrone oxygenase family protein [Paracoccus salsus]MCF3972440.1 DUF1772 domain-containing protein [Paracoccus salsus]
MIGIQWCCAFLSLLLAGALFGFFYAWVCSTMWGLDNATPGVAIAAMQAMNESVRNAVFAPAFFGTGPALLVTAALFAAAQDGRAALFFAAAGLICLLGAFLPTMAVNVPMNEALARIALPLPEVEAARIWAAYSPRWQIWNTIRCVAMGASLLLTGLGIAVAARHGVAPRIA